MTETHDAGDAMELLRRRLAAGEITAEEFDAITQRISTAPGARPPLPRDVAAEYAHFGWRLLAWLIDCLWIVPLYLILEALTLGWWTTEINLGWEITAQFAGGAAVILFWAAKRATPGKMAVRVQIVDAKTGGTPAIGALVIRYLGYILSALPLGLGFFWMLWDERRQTWHDKLAGTLVLRSNGQRPANVTFE